MNIEVPSSLYILQAKYLYDVVHVEFLFKNILGHKIG